MALEKFIYFWSTSGPLPIFIQSTSGDTKVINNNSESFKTWNDTEFDFRFWKHFRSSLHWWTRLPVWTLSEKVHIASYDNLLRHPKKLWITWLKKREFRSTTTMVNFGNSRLESDMNRSSEVDYRKVDIRCPRWSSVGKALKAEKTLLRAIPRFFTIFLTNGSHANYS